MAQCKDCKYLDFSQRTSVGYVCTNSNRLMRTPQGPHKPLNHLKSPTTKACKSGFEPREDVE